MILLSLLIRRKRLSKSIQAGDVIGSSLFDGCSTMLMTFVMLYHWILTSSMKIHAIQEAYMDPATDRACQSSELNRVVRDVGGLVISHRPYGSPYWAEKNCVLVLQAPEGYQIQLKVLEFSVNGKPDGKGICNGDSLYVLDQDESVAETDGIQSPGPIVGQFCGKINNRTVLVVASSKNILTLWWHTAKLGSSTEQDARFAAGKERQDRAGFRLIWSAFRTTSNDLGCQRQTEFACRDNKSCIPLSLACDEFAQCYDASDLDLRIQKQIGCQIGTEWCELAFHNPLEDQGKRKNEAIALLLEFHETALHAKTSRREKHIWRNSVWRQLQEFALWLHSAAFCFWSACSFAAILHANDDNNFRQAGSLCDELTWCYKQTSNKE